MFSNITQVCPYFVCPEFFSITYFFYSFVTQKTGYGLMDFAPIVVLLNTILHKKPKETLSTVRNKYSHKIFHQVTTIPLMDINILFEKFSDVTQKLSLTHLTYQSVIATCSSSQLNEKNSKESALYCNAKEQKIETKSIPLPHIR